MLQARRVAIAVLALVGAVLTVGALLPRAWRVERSIVIAAPPDKIVPLVTNLRRWQDWSAWTRELDPALRNTFEGPEAGAGASWAWLGPTIGRGQLEITQADATGLQLELALEQTSVNAHARLAWSRVEAGTLVTWTDEGRLPPLLGGFFLSVVNHALGDAIDESLRRLKSRVEGAS
jgi:Polyketide cyclase / dehydrase and lipid transport